MMAKAVVQTVYVDGKPKKAKQCRECGHLKLLEEFSKSSTGIGGRHTYCKPCDRELARLRKEKRLKEEAESKSSTQLTLTVNEDALKRADCEPPSLKQIRFIQSIEADMPHVRFMGRTRAEARRFIQLISAGREALKTNMLR